MVRVVHIRQIHTAVSSLPSPRTRTTAVQEYTSVLLLYRLPAVPEFVQQWQENPTSLLSLLQTNRNTYSYYYAVKFDAPFTSTFTTAAAHQILQIYPSAPWGHTQHYYRNLNIVVLPANDARGNLTKHRALVETGRIHKTVMGTLSALASCIHNRQDGTRLFAVVRIFLFHKHHSG